MSVAVAQILRPGQTVVERYRLVRPIGQGGMGSVWEVVHSRLGRQFALKVMSENLVDDAQALVRFRREADLIASLRHPNIIEIVDLLDLENGQPCIVMEYLEGEDLAQRIKRHGALDWATVAMVGEQMLSALSVAHGQGIVHRDLKPKNIFIARDPTGREYCKLLDFGLSKSMSLDSLTVSSTSGIGTPAYMAPEQADTRLGKAGSHTDIWAMGVVLFEVATGQRPFDDETAMATLYQICHGEPRSFGELRQDAPDGFSEAIDRALSRNPDQRFPSAEAFRKHLEEIFGPLAEHSHSGRGLESSPKLGQERPAGRKRRRKVRDTSALSDTVANPTINDTIVDGSLRGDQIAEAAPALITHTEVVRPGRRRSISLLAIAGGALCAVTLFVATRSDSSDGANSPQKSQSLSEPVEDMTPPAAALAPASEGAPETAADSAAAEVTGAEAAVPAAAEIGQLDAPQKDAAPVAAETPQVARPRSRTKKRNKRTKKRPRKPDDATPEQERKRGTPLDPF